MQYYRWIKGLFLIVFIVSSFNYLEAKPFVDTLQLTPDEINNIEVFKQTNRSVVWVTNSQIQQNVFTLDVQEISRGMGTGFVWDHSGLIVTNYHVIENADKVTVVLWNNSTWNAKIVGTAPGKDLAVLKIEAPGETIFPVTVGDSSQLQVGRKVLAIGNPFGFDTSLTVGVVSALGREIKSFGGRTIKGVIQTDASINRGNSGGPLLNSSGELIGVNAMIFSPTGTSLGIGFAIPVNTVKKIIPQLIQHGHVVRPIIGFQMADDSIAQRYGISGVIIFRIIEGYPAEKAGMIGLQRDRQGRTRIGDIIVKVDNKPVKNNDDLLTALEQHEVGDVVQIETLRGNQKKQFKVTLTKSTE